MSAPKIDPTAPDAAANLGSRAIVGAAITFARFGGQRVFGLLANLVVTRMVEPRAYGLMSILWALIAGLTMFSDVGIQQSIIRSERGDDPAFLDTLWTMQLIRAFGIWAVATALAIPFAGFFEEPLLVQMVPVAALGTIIESLAPNKQAVLNRHLKLAQAAIQDMWSQLLGLIVMIVLAYLWRSPWALLLGSTAQALFRTTLSYLFLPGRNNRLRWEPQARQELFGFGRWVFVSTLLTFASQSADRLIFGKLLSVETVGVYGVGKQIASAPTEAVSHIGSNVVFPFYSRVVTSGQPLAPEYQRARKPLLLLAGWGLATLAATGNSIVQFLYDDRYADAGWVLQVIAVASWFNLLWSTNVQALLALGQSRWMAATTALKTVAVVALIPVGVHYGGFPGAVLALAAADVIQVCLSATAVYLNRLAPLWQDLPLTGYVLATAAVGYYVSRMLGANAFFTTVAGALVVLALWLPNGWPVARKVLRKQGGLFG